MTTRIFPQCTPTRERPICLGQLDAIREKTEGEQPTYAGTFRCIGPQCEDICCGNWDIPVDKITYVKYRQFPDEALGSLVSHFVSACGGNPHDNLHASIRRKQD